KISGFLFVLSWLCLSPSFTQRSEIGFGRGTFNYTGEVVRSYNIRISKPGATAFYRSNIGPLVSFRAALTDGKLAASETPIDTFASIRDASFDIFLMEASTVMEYHFLNWRETKRFVRFTPYVFAGLALYGFTGNEAKSAEYSNI